MLRLPLLLLLCTLPLVAADPGITQLNYKVRVAPGGEGGYSFEIEVINPNADELAFVIPFWAPGAYRKITVQPRSGPDSWEQLTDFAAVDGQGKERAVRAAGDRRWTINAKGAKRIVFRYRNSDPSSRANNRSYLREKSGVIDGPRNWMYLEGKKHLPVHVHFDLPEGWKVGTGLDPTFDPMIFTAKDYDRLADCPTLVGLFDEWRFLHRGVPHRVLAATEGEPIRFDVDEFMDMVQRIVKVYVDMFDDVPYEHYTFIYTSGGGGGLEHLTSTTIGGSRANAMRARFLQGVTAHEFFHVWNVKRLRPFKLGPFDYTGPVPVNDLWICEGLTSYYTTVGLWRAELTDDAGFRQSMSRAIGSYMNNPRGWYEPSEVSSFKVWEGGPLRYYNTGQVLGICIDLLIREETDNRHDLDDVMREMYRRYGGYYRHLPPEPGYQSEDWVKVTKEITGVDVEPFWNAHIRGSEPVDWNRWLGYAGWKLEMELEGVSAFRQIVLRRGAGDRAEIRAPEGSVLHDLGFRNGDLVAAVGEREISSVRAARRRLQRLAAGSEFEVSVLRGGETVKVTGTVPSMSESGAITFEAGEEAAVVSIVPTDLAWYRAGLNAGDRIISVQGTETPTLAAAQSAMAGVPVRETISLLVARDGKRIELQAEQRPFLRPRVGGMVTLDGATPRQLAIRQGIKSGSSDGI